MVKTKRSIIFTNQPRITTWASVAGKKEAEGPLSNYFDICSKEITVVGSWVYTLRDYATTFDFLKRAKAIGLPLEKLITHKFHLADANEALQTNLRQDGLKIAIIP